MATFNLTEQTPGLMTPLVDNEGQQEQIADTSTIQPAPEQVVQPPQQVSQPVSLEPESTSPTVITTDSLRAQLDEGRQKLQALQEQINAGAAQTTTEQVPEPEPVTPTETLTPEQQAQSQIDAYTKETKSILDARKKEFDKFTSRSNSLLRGQVNSIQAEFDKRREQAEAVAANAKAATNVLGARTGRLRYAPEIQRGILTGQENALITTLGEIDAQEAATIAAAESAAFERDYTTFLDKIEDLDSIEKQRETALSELQEIMKAENEKREEEVARTKNEALIIEQITAGTTDPITIFSSLNGNVPFDLIKEYTDTLPGGGVDEFEFKTGDKYQPAGVFNKSTGVFTALRGGGGTGVVAGNAVGYGTSPVKVGNPSVEGLGNSYDTSSVDAQLMIDDIVNGLPTQLINNVAEIPRWREAVRKQLNAGYTPQQVVDKLSGFRLFEGSDKNLGTVLYNMSTGTDLEPGDLASLINRGATEQAMTSVENAQLQNVRGFFADTDKARSTIAQAENVLNILNDPAFPKEKLGAFDGRVFKLNRQITPQEEIKVQQLESALQLLNAPIRVEIVGTAATESEMSKITGFQAEVLDQPQIVESKVQDLRDSVLMFHNQARSQRGLPQVDGEQVLDNRKRLELYRGIGNEEQSVANSSLSNSDLFDMSGAVDTDVWSTIGDL